MSKNTENSTGKAEIRGPGFEEDIFIRDMPEASGWKCQLFGSKYDGITFYPRKGDVPNWFWRWMQYLAFGNRWEKSK